MGKKKKGILGPPAYRKSSNCGPARPCRRVGRANSQTTKAPQACRLKSNLQQQCSAVVEKLLCAAETGAAGGTVKGLCLAPHITNKRAVYAVVCETLKHAPLLKKILEATDFFTLHPWIRSGTALVLLYDHLLGQGVKAHGKVERTLLSYSDCFKQHQQELLAEAPGATSLSDLLPKEYKSRGHEAKVQRYIRCNTLVTTTDDVVTQLHQPPSSWPARHQHHIAMKDIQRGAGMPAVLAVPAGLIVHDHPLVSAGHVVIQGRSSCMPAHALSPQPGWTVMDCCAAPGNKTTQVAAMVGMEGSVIALDKDRARCELLRGTVARCQASNVQVIHQKHPISDCCGPMVPGFGGVVHPHKCVQDFLKVDPRAQLYAAIQAILLDPSCSGSGTANSRMDFLLPQVGGYSDAVVREGVDGAHEFPGPISSAAQRVKSLAAFQTRALQHALSFPNARRVVYSTCSVYVEENENVVAAVMSDAAAAGWRLDHALPFWHRRGLTSLFPWAEKVVRVHPDLDGGDGFFVAVFQRNC